MSVIVNEFKSIINLYFIFLVIAIGLFTFFVDVESLKQKQLNKEERLAKIIGIVYIVGGPVLFVILKMM